VEIEAVHSGRTQCLPWRELTDTARWLQGWR
jgi:ribosome modulation factor